MCGIVVYFGGAGNNLTRVLTGMSAIIYRAPDSTGVGLFGDDAEPIRTRKAVGSVGQLVEVLLREQIYPNRARDLISRWFAGSNTLPLHAGQRRLLELEELPLDLHQALLEAQRRYPSFDELVDLHAAEPINLKPGWPGRPAPLPVFLVRSRKDLRRVIRGLTADYDLSSVVIKSIIRKALLTAFAGERAEERVVTGPAELLQAFDQLFEKIFLEEKISRPRPPAYGWVAITPRAQKDLWRCLTRTHIEIPPDYDRDGVLGVFRVLDAALLSRLQHNPRITEAVEQYLAGIWPEAGRNLPLDWRSLYLLERAMNVYGRAAAAATAYLQREELLPELFWSVKGKESVSEKIATGKTDPISLRYFASPILSQGRWALQAPVTLKNAHPFFDGAKQRLIVLNGRFNGETEEKIHEFLQQVGGYEFRSRNSSEYFPFLWEYYYELLSNDKKRYEAIRTQIEAGLDDYSIGSQAIDYQIYHMVKGKTAVALDEIAFLEATRRMIRQGGQIAVAGMSLLSPRKVYVASHNRPVFVVHRTENDDFMVVSDINAAMGLFPQAWIRDKILELRELKKQQATELKQLKAAGESKHTLRACKKQFKDRADELLEAFRVRVFPLDGEENFVRITTCFEDGKLSRRMTITDFEGKPLPGVEPFTTLLNPLQIGKDVYGSFYETHLHEIPERLEDILRIYVPEEGELPRFDLRQRFLRRRFGAGFSTLKRIVLVGMGSAYNAGMLAQSALRKILPNLDVVLLRPVEIDDLSRSIIPEEDLVVLLSWSGTTADMVQFAKELKSSNGVMIGITEKRFADMGLIAQRSGGVIDVLSGEEVTVSALKSTIAMLFCVNLLGIWLAAQAGNEDEARNMLKALQRMPDSIAQILEDESVEEYAKNLASKSSQSYACVIADDLCSAGTGREAALKLEEASWAAMGKSVDYGDLEIQALKAGMDQNLVVVNATNRARFPEALRVMKKLYLAGIPFAAVSFANQNEEEIRDYSQDEYICLPKTEDELQPFPDLVYYYLLAFHYGLAHGRNAEDFPRNRAKSVTSGRSPLTPAITPAAEFFRLAQINREPLKGPLDGHWFTEPSVWERAAGPQWERSYYRQMRRLAGSLAAKDPLQALLQGRSAKLEELSDFIFENVVEEGEIIFVPLDRAADAAAKNLAAEWGRFLGCFTKVVPVAGWPKPCPEGALVVVLAGGVPNKNTIARLMSCEEAPMLWLGPQIPEEFALVFENSLGCYLLADGLKPRGSDQLYAAVGSLLVQAWQRRDPEKSRVLRDHLTRGAQVIKAVLDDEAFREDLLEIMAANRSYRTAFFLSPRAGTGGAWRDRFDRTGALLMEWHPLGESVHGPLVTVDPRVRSKFVRLQARSKLVSNYGEEEIRRWENRFLGGENIDIFLNRYDADFGPRVEKPFFAEGNWYFPVLRKNYDTLYDNLIFVDATSRRRLSQALDELSTYGCRYGRMIVISQRAFLDLPEIKALYKYPISHLLLLPALPGEENNLPVSGLLLPFAMNLAAAAAAGITSEIRQAEKGAGTPTAALEL